MIWPIWIDLASKVSLFLRRFSRVAWTVTLYWVSFGFNEVFTSPFFFLPLWSSGETTDMSPFNNLVPSTRLPPCRQLVFHCWSQRKILSILFSDIFSSILAIGVFFSKNHQSCGTFGLWNSSAWGFAGGFSSPSFDAICKRKLYHLMSASQLLWSPESLQISPNSFRQQQSVSLCTRPCLPTCASSINSFL